MSPSAPETRSTRCCRPSRTSQPRLLVIVTALALAVIAAAAGGCTGGSSSSDLGGPDFITIATISPPAGTKLAPGSSVTFTAGLSYILNSSGAASIIMVIEDQDGRVLNPANEVTTIVSRGTGTLQLSEQLTIPTTGVTQVKVVFTLGPSPAFAPPSVAVIAYTVG